MENKRSSKDQEEEEALVKWECTLREERRSRRIEEMKTWKHEKDEGMNEGMLGMIGRGSNMFGERELDMNKDKRELDRWRTAWIERRKARRKDME
jgi:hypothetical protein